MNALRHKWVAVLAIAVVAVGVLRFWQRSREPRYKGKTVRLWLAMAKPEKSHSTNGQVSFTGFTGISGHRELQRMLDALGSNAAPSLIKIMDDGDSTMTGLKTAVARSKWDPVFIKSAASADLMDLHHSLSIAADAIRYLGSNAVHIAPDLERITCDPEKMMASYSAASALAGFGLQALPALRRSLTNAPSVRRQMISGIIQNIYREALRSYDAREREAAALGLSEYPRPPFEMIFVLLDILKSPDPDRQKQSLKALAIHLPTVAPFLVVAREAITNAAASEDSEIRRLANGILADLRPIDSKQKP
jgi:hypothetical protein